ncbi:MAG: rhodanese-like domain-containing protein [Gammaproteobacteria bacterium]
MVTWYKPRFVILLVVLATALPGHAGDDDYRAPESVEGATTVTAAQVKELFDAGVVIVDVRNPRLYARRHIPGAQHLDLKDVFSEASLAAVVNKDEPLVIYCSGVKCTRSSRASARAVSWGYKKVYYFRGGIVEWRDAGYPVASGES